MTIQLPQTLADFMSPEGKAAIAQAQLVLNALQNLSVVVIKSGVRQPPVAVKISNQTAVLEITV